MVDSVSKTSIISIVYVASSMRSAKLFRVSKPEKLNKINKKAARKGSFFCCAPVMKNGKRISSQTKISCSTCGADSGGESRGFPPEADDQLNPSCIWADFKGALVD